jgi:peptidoglycan/xylan/chitin deacetylase (PgdA/CDA1 family)
VHKFSIFTISSFLLIALALFFLNGFIAVGIGIVYLGIIIWGVIDISSQLFIKTYCNNPHSSGKIAITFDDGPHENTSEILNLLDQYHAKASFFLIGKNIVKHYDIANEIHQRGHLVGNHSFSHKNTFPLLSQKKMEEELKKTQYELKKITGQENLFFRPPFGVTNPTIARTVRKLNLQTIGWNIRSFDTKKSLSTEKIAETIVSKLNAGDIILLHDKTRNICRLTEKILHHLKQKNLTAVTIDELIKDPK